MSNGTTDAPAATQTGSPGKGLLIGSWVARLVAAGIFAMGAIPKFTGNAGMLVDALADYGGKTAVLGIGVGEAIAIVLLLIPRTALFGGALGVLLMLGAVGSHVVGPVGMEGDAGAMFPLAVVALLASGATVGFELKRRKG